MGELSPFSGVSVPHLLWLLLAATSLTVQLLSFCDGPNRRLYLAKKITTPMLLFGGLGVLVLGTGRFPVIAGTVLLAMGLGELGIEGSQVVEFRESEDGDDDEPPPTPWTVTAAGVLFLLVNVFLGGALLLGIESTRSLLMGTISGFAFVAIMAGLTIASYRPSPTVRTQLLAYSGGLAILAAGAFSNLAAGLEPLGQAALVLTVSDSLVLIRMGANWDKRTRAGGRIQLVFLVVILLLYYAYIWLLMRG